MGVAVHRQIWAHEKEWSWLYNQVPSILGSDRSLAANRQKREVCPEKTNAWSFPHSISRESEF